MIKKFLLTIALIATLPAFANIHGENLSANDALLKLKEGNGRFSHNKLQHPDQSKVRMAEIEKSQHPFVAILSCADSRVPPEIIFDQGLGDIFEIRNAGNVIDKHVLGSIEYAIIHLGVKLVVVMGHQDCGAVGATIAGKNETKNINSIINFIKPSLELAKKQQGCLVENTIKNNVSAAKENIENDKVLKEYLETKGVKVIEAYYHLDNGAVLFSE